MSVEDPVDAVLHQLRPSISARGQPTTNGALLGSVARKAARRPRERAVLPPLYELSIALDDQRQDELNHTAPIIGIADRCPRNRAPLESRLVCAGEGRRGRSHGVESARSDVCRRVQTIFEIGSISKVFTATVLADMVEEGLVAFDDPVQRYLPDDVVLPIRGRPVTLADLATQTSGLPRLPAGLLRQSLRKRQNPYARFTAADLHRAIAAARLHNEPGEKLRYSNFGFGLLGHVLALRTGQTYEKLVRERICEPLGLTDTRISIPAHALSRFADGHNRRGRRVPHWDLPALAAAGALRSTVADLLRFLDLQLREPATRLERAARATHEPRAHRGRLLQGLAWVGLPLRRSSLRMLCHNGGTGGFRSFAGFVHESGTGVVVLSNCSRSVDAIGFETLEAINES